MLLKKENQSNETQQYQKWNNILQWEINWGNIFKNNFKSYAYAPIQNILFKIQHRGIKTNSTLASWSRNKDNRTNKCKTCGKTEDIIHTSLHTATLIPKEDFSPKNTKLN